MPRFLIEVAHEAEVVACARAVKVLLETGSHYLTNADFGCMDDDHRAWIVIECDTKEEARMAVPPPFRANARVVALNKFSVEAMNELLKHHAG